MLNDGVGLRSGGDMAVDQRKQGLDDLGADKMSSGRGVGHYGGDAIKREVGTEARATGMQQGNKH